MISRRTFRGFYKALVQKAFYPSFIPHAGTQSREIDQCRTELNSPVATMFTIPSDRETRFVPRTRVDNLFPAHVVGPGYEIIDMSQVVIHLS
jgi:hypothetical protein